MDFDSVLKNSLKVVNEGYQKALSDLKEVVENLSSAVARNGDQRFAVYLQETTSDIKGGSFRLRFDTNINNPRARVLDIMYLRIPTPGYPIVIGSYDKNSMRFFPETDMNSKDELVVYFMRLIENPESTLIQSIGFAMRKSVDEEEDPF